MRRYYIKVYQASALKREWRWRMRSAANLRIIAASSEGYADRRGVLANLKTVTGLVLPEHLRGRKASAPFTWEVWR